MRASWIHRIVVLLALAVWTGSVKAEPTAVAGEEALEVLDAFSRIATLEPGEKVLGLVGFYGQPLPAQWLVLSGNVEKRAPLRESVFARGQVLAERRFAALPGQDLPHLPVLRGSLKIRSSEAFRIAETSAKSRQVSFESAHFQLRVRDEGAEPVWMLNLLDKAQVPVGLVYLSATSGEILRESWPRPGSRPTETKVSVR